MKRALLIGIDKYDQFNDLAGCVNDVTALAPLLARNDDDSLNFECVSRTASSAVTRDGVLKALDLLLAPTADVALLYFAGHGAVVDGDVFLVTRDGSGANPGVPFNQVLSKIQQSQVREVIVVLDCCFAGAAGKIPALGGESSTLRPGVAILAAARDDQTSEETAAGRGLFSTYLEGALEGGAADVCGKVTVAGVYAYLDELFGAWEQRPVFKANVDRLGVLRQAAPAVKVGDLKTMAAQFSDARAELQLDPSYEDTLEPRNPKNEAILKVLQACRAAKLVEPVGEDHLYYAAKNSKPCRLTPLGRHYWLQIKKGRL